MQRHTNTEEKCKQKIKGREGNSEEGCEGP